MLAAFELIEFVCMGLVNSKRENKPCHCTVIENTLTAFSFVLRAVKIKVSGRKGVLRKNTILCYHRKTNTCVLHLGGVFVQLDSEHCVNSAKKKAS